MDPQLKNWVIQNSVCVKREESFTIYQLKTSCIYENEWDKVRVVTVGPQTHGEMKTILLLGETGNGKTLFLNAFLNRFFGVSLNDDVRLQLKDQIDEANKRSTRSQTDYTTVYTIYRQVGMPHRYNYRIIDTPGFGDTDGRHKDAINERAIRFCLGKHTLVKELNSVGLVWKACDYRYDQRKREILSKVEGLLGYDIKAILDVLLTFSTNDNQDALRVIEQSGITYNGVFPFDNIHIYKNIPTKGKLGNLLKYQWDELEECHNVFLNALNRRRPVSLNNTAELLQSEPRLEASFSELQALQLQKSEIHNMMKRVKRERDALSGTEGNVDSASLRALDSSNRTIQLDGNQHCHYCRSCDKVCIAECTKETDQEDLTNTLAEVIGGVTIFGLIPLLSGQTIIPTCEKCPHNSGQHNRRSWIRARDATRAQKMKLAKEDQRQKVRNEKSRLNAELEACEDQMEEIEEQIERTDEMQTDLVSRINWLKHGR